MNILLSTDDIKRLATDFNLSVAMIKSVLIVESSGQGFDAATGKIKIQFEAQWFERFEKTKILNGVESQKKEWEAYEKAYAISPESAMKATSWGLGQVMGFNHKQAGYDSVSAMVKEFKMSEYYQLRGMLKFISSNNAMFRALQAQNWGQFAYWYNGPKYRQFNYDVRLADAYLKVKESFKNVA